MSRNGNVEENRTSTTTENVEEGNPDIHTLTSHHPSTD